MGRMKSPRLKIESRPMADSSGERANPDGSEWTSSFYLRDSPVDRPVIYARFSHETVLAVPSRLVSQHTIVKVVQRGQGLKQSPPPPSPVLVTLGAQGRLVTGPRTITIGIKVLLSLSSNFSGSPTPDGHSLNHDQNASDARTPTQRPQRRADVRVTAAK